MRPVQRSSPVVLAALLLAACGGSGGGASIPTVTASPPRGTLLQSPPELLSTLTASSLLLELNIAANQQLLSLSGAPVCDILMYHIEYATVGGANEPTTASAALLVPTGFGANCTGARPIVLYAHGTTTDRDNPTAVSPLSDAVAIAAGTHHTCALTNGGAKDLWPGGHWLTDLTQRTLGDTATNTLYNRTVVPGGMPMCCW